MERLAWKAAYATGIRVIDDDHKMLFSIINNLVSEVNSETEEDPRQVESLLEALVQYVGSHFAREELFLEQFGYPGLNEHRDGHDALRYQIDDISSDYKENPDNVDLGKVSVFLKSWLSEHILKSDMDYVPYLNGEKRSKDEGLRTVSQQVTVAVPVGRGRLIHELAHELRHSQDIDSAVRHFSDAHFSGAYRKRSFRKDPA
jgi:hemerythrin